MSKALLIVVVVALPLVASNPPEAGCSFRTDPAEFLQAQSRAQRAVHERIRAKGIPRNSAQNAATVDPASVRRRNFIDEEIFGQLQRMTVQAAQRSSDADFVRRIHLDLTGRIPSADAVREFLSNSSANRREELIEKLLYSPEFADRWAVWFADLTQATERLSTSARAPQIEGRNALDLFLRESMRNLKPVRQIVTELLTGTGNNYYIENGPANYAVLGSTAMGPAQDTYDMLFSRSATSFLGVSSYDCLLCHSGRGHLNGINLWGEGATRSDAQRMAAFFSRVRLTNGAPAGARQYEHVLYNSTLVADSPTGQYDLNTTSGNRPVRAPVGTARNFTPEYRDGTKPANDENWRAFFAGKLTNDPMFFRNFANRVWKHFMGLGLVDPVDTLDPARLDPKSPPPAPWTLQATHPELLERLAEAFRSSDTDLRALIRLIVQSSAYQLSSDYDGEWKYEYVSLFARHYPRRLDAEEVHDAIVQATGLQPRYTWPTRNGQTLAQGSALPQSEVVSWAMQLPDINEPRNAGGARDFMTAFYRGNRDTAQRLQSGSIQQQMALMNNAFVLDRIRATGNAPSPVLVDLVKISDNAQLVEEFFLKFLSRQPTGEEKERSIAHVASVRNRTDAVQDLAWACINKLDFVFSY